MYSVVSRVFRGLGNLGVAEEVISARRPGASFRFVLAEPDHVERDLKLLLGLHTYLLHHWHYGVACGYGLSKVPRLRTQWLAGSRAEDD